MLAEYKLWHWDQIRTGDLDPMYPFLRAWTRLNDLTPDESASLTLTYLVYYRIDSAYQAWSQHRRIPISPRKYPTGTERRALRDPKQLAAHLESLNSHVADQPHDWLTGATSWNSMGERVMSVYGNGRWAAYKACDLATKVHDAPWEAPDAGHAHSTGPRKGLSLLGVPDPGGNTPENIKYLDDATTELASMVGDMDISQIETSLCDFYSHKKGRHPLGHDVIALAGMVRNIPGGPSAFRAAGLSAR